MRRLSLIMGVIFILVCLLLALIQGWMGEWSSQFLARLEQAGYFAIGWSTAVTGWLLSGHLAASYLFQKAPKAWRLWQTNVLASRLPILKYLVGGLLFVALGILLGAALWGLFGRAFDVGLLVGAVFGLVYSFRKVYRLANDQIAFLDANQRYLNEEKVPLFSDEWT